MTEKFREFQVTLCIFPYLKRTTDLEELEIPCRFSTLCEIILTWVDILFPFKDKSFKGFPSVFIPHKPKKYIP